MPGRVVISFIDKSHDLSTLLKARSYALYIAGHTHEDIDAMFKVIAHKLRKSQIPDFKALVTAIAGCFTLAGSIPLQVFPSESVADWKAWLKPCFVGMTHHTEPHVFKFERNEAGEARMWYRKNFSFKSWQPNEDGAPVLKAEPQGQPSWTCSQEIKHADQVHPSQNP